MKRTLVVGFTLALAGCGSSSGGTGPATGPLKMGIVSGNDQMVNAGATQLTAPVVGRMVRLPNGTLAFHIESPAERVGNRLLDLLVPRAYAQTVVTGSPVPGAVVCAVSVDSVHKLTPFVPCTNTDANGQATFFFTPGTTAGVASAQIRGTLNNSPAVFDTAKATVTADTTAPSEVLTPRYPVGMTPYGGVSGYAINSAKNTYGVSIHHAGTTIDLSTVIDSVVDKYHNRIATYTVGWTIVQLSSETLATADSNGMTWVGGYPPAVPASLATAPAAHATAAVTGFQPGYVVLATYIDGVFQGTTMLAVLP